jgi:cell division protein FtsW
MPTIRSDYILIIATALLIILGVIILGSASVASAKEKFGTPYYYLKHQIFFGILPGIASFFVALKIPLKRLKKLVPWLLLINLIMVALIFIPGLGKTSGGATRWFFLGENISLQPSEFLKLSSLLYFASFLAARTSQRKTFIINNSKDFTKTFTAFLIVIGVMSLLLILQPDISTLGIIIAVGFLIYFLAGTPLWHTFLMIMMGLVSLSVLIKLAPYRTERLLVFLNPEIDPLGMAYQIKQSLIAVGSGGIFGLGLGMSRQKFGFLPQPITDSVFAIFAEEAGFLGAVILISLFLLVLWQGFRIYTRASDKFLQLTGFGITFWIVLQAFLNIGAMIGILPLTGIPLPFISYGGSHLINELTGIGILLNISRNSNKV